jgi:hypothetical protein
MIGQAQKMRIEEFTIIDQIILKEWNVIGEKIQIGYETQRLAYYEYNEARDKFAQ